MHPQCQVDNKDQSEDSAGNAGRIFSCRRFGSRPGVGMRELLGSFMPFSLFYSL